MPAASDVFAEGGILCGDSVAVVAAAQRVTVTG